MNLEHKKRWISGLIGLALLLGLYFGLGHVGVIAIAVAISVASYWEFLSFSGASGGARWLSLAAGAALSAWLCLQLPGALEAIYLASLAVLLRGLWRVHSSSADQLAGEVSRLQARVFGLTYLVVFPSFVPRVHALPHGPWLLLFMIGIVWLGDIGAYYGGKTMGRHKLSPIISPGKTLEGSAAGLLACGVWAVAYGAWALPHLPLWKLALVAVLSSVVAQAGDLLESLMKRAYSVKDSGGMIPGHGGVFDRFDSLILVAPFFYLLLRLTT
jgi:phosphatidate cytidylyltransferase